MIPNRRAPGRTTGDWSWTVARLPGHPANWESTISTVRPPCRRDGTRPCARRRRGPASRPGRRRCASGQRVEYGQPRAPPTRCPRGARPLRAAWRAAGVDAGIASSSARVYGCRGAAVTATDGPRSTTVPAYITDDLVAHAADDVQVVRDHEQADAALALEVEQQVQDLRLHRDVERRGRLVAHDELADRGPARARCRCAGAARPRTRPGRRPSRSRPSRPTSAGARARGRPARCGRTPCVSSGSATTSRDREPRVERLVRVLEDHPDRFGGQPAATAPSGRTARR